MGSLDSATPSQILDGTWPKANARGYTIDERPALSPTRKRIIGIGAGMSGISLAMQVQRRNEDVDLQIFEQGSNYGGNWFWNQYPGLACDNPGITYQYIKDTSPDWPSFYSKGPEIRDYLQDLVAKNNLDKYFHLRSEVTKAEWSDESCQWSVTVKDIETGRIYVEVADVVISCVGCLHHPKWPDLKNSSAFKGIYVHASRYPDQLDLKGKRVAVLGTGASGVQILPAIVDDVEKIYHWVRQPTYILPSDTGKADFHYTPEQLKRFREDPTYYLKYRKALEHRSNAFAQALMSGTEDSAAITKLCVEDMKRKLAGRPDLIDKVIPKNWAVGCRRPTTGPGYLETLCHDKVHMFFEGILEMTEAGFRDADGKEHEIDVFICATGFDSSYVPHFPVLSRGVNLQQKWSENDPDCYLSMASPGFPNYFFTCGPWGPTAHGSAVPISEVMIESFLDWTQKMATEQISSMEPTKEATDDFLEHAALWLQRTVFMQPCRSWWKSGKSGLPMCFPGSRVSIIEAAKTFRAEDWKFTYPSGNRFRFWGNGVHPKEVDNYDDTYYLGLIDEKEELPDYGTIVEDIAGQGRPATKESDNIAEKVKVVSGEEVTF